MTKKKRIKVLLVEDNSVDARLIENMLLEAKHTNFKLEWVDRLSKGLARLSAASFDVVLLDLKLPDSRGINTFTKAHHSNPRVPIIPLTGIEDDLLADRLVRAGAQDYLVKGDVESNLLESAIRYAIERKRAEQALAESEQRYRTLFEATCTATIVVGEDSIITLANAEFEKLSGYAKEELEGEVGWLEFLEEEDVERILGYSGWRAVNALAAPRTFDVKFTDKHNSVKDVVMTASTLPGGKTHVASLLDITDRKKMEEELLRMKKLESIGILAAGIAHDFNNVLTGILGNVSLARMLAEPDGKLAQRLAEAEKGAYRAEELTRQLSVFAKGGVPVKQTTWIEELVRKTAGFALAGSSAQCRLAAKGEISPVDVDQGQMSQALSNILVNAKEAMPKGGLISAEIETITVDGTGAYPGTTLQPGRYVRIWIADEGQGISKNDIDKIFDPYFTTKSKASGLGLATAYSIIEKHGGRLSVQSEEGHGTQVSIFLPCSKKAITPTTVVDDQILTGSGRVLVMDDEHTIRLLTENMLEMLGYEGDFASDGSEAIELYRSALEQGKPYDVVIMDLTVPGGMGGAEAIRKIVEIDPDVKAIVSSGYSDDPVVANYRDYGFRGAMPKPYRIQELSRALWELTTRNGKMSDPS